MISGAVLEKTGPKTYLEYEYEPFVAAMSTILILVSIVLLVILDRTVGMTGEKATRN